MWRVLMAVVAGAFLVQMDLDVSVEERSLGADAALCADEVPGVEVTAPVAMPGGVPAGGGRAAE